MTITAALFTRDGFDCAVVLVERSVMEQSVLNKNRLAKLMSRAFPGAIVVLCAQNIGDRLHYYYGRPDIVKVLYDLSFDQLPWSEYGRPTYRRR